MGLIIKRTIFSILFNISLFLILILGIQNSSNRSKVYLLSKETVELPISFLVGSSFIVGSIFGSFIDLKMHNE